MLGRLNTRNIRGGAEIADGLEIMTEAAAKKPWFRIILAAILDFITIFAIGGYIIAKLTGNTTDGGFELNGWPALLLFAIIIAYFWLGSRYAGGTLWQRIFRTRR